MAKLRSNLYCTVATFRTVWHRNFGWPWFGLYCKCAYGRYRNYGPKSNLTAWVHRPDCWPYTQTPILSPRTCNPNPKQVSTFQLRHSPFLLGLFWGLPRSQRLSSHSRLNAFVIQTKLTPNNLCTQPFLLSPTHMLRYRIVWHSLPKAF